MNRFQPNRNRWMHLPFPLIAMAMLCLLPLLPAQQGSPSANDEKTAVPACISDWVDLLKPGLPDWEILGEGKWNLDDDYILTGYREEDLGRLRQLTPFDFTMVRGWVTAQSWLYTKREYGQFDLSLEYWVRSPGNGGVSIRDKERAACGIRIPPDFSCTPSKTGYEIQINSEWPDKWATGSIYGLVPAYTEPQRRLDWNSMEIQSRNDRISVRVNGEPVAEHPGDPRRPKAGPIGLQLHDLTSFVRFRNVRIREICE
jgi:hypothetical protein